MHKSVAARLHSKKRANNAAFGAIAAQERRRGVTKSEHRSVTGSERKAALIRDA
jgi:hypothetical protein